MRDPAPAGDVNGDGEADVLVTGSGGGNGIVRVFFGPLPMRDASLDESPSRGFSIYGPDPEDFGVHAASAGDVNGDGLDDVLFVRYGYESAAYVVFGNVSPGDVDLTAFDSGTQGDDGFRIDGDFTPEGGTLGDTDGDRRADFFVASYGRTYVIRGKSDSFPIDVDTFDYGIQGNAGYVVEHAHPRRGYPTLAAAGDVNADGLGDFAIATGRRDWAQKVWILLGTAENEEIRTAELGEHGYLLEAALGGAGIDLANAGDVNGDDRDDLVVGDASSNMAYVVFGRSETSKVSLFRLGKRGYRIFGPPQRGGWFVDASMGRWVAGGEDVNADGLSDVLVSAPGADFRRRRDSGSAYLLFGKGDTKPIRVTRLGDRGIRIDGEKLGSNLGNRPALPGDVTDDGLPDVLLGEYGERSAGAVHVLSNHLLF